MTSLEDVLFTQGFGTRRVCRGLVQHGHVALGEPPQVCDDPDIPVQPDGFRFWVDGKPWDFRQRAYLMLHKPAGYECSQRPSAYPSVNTLLPAPLRQRGGGAAAGVQPVGRLDQDTTGLLLLSDDGAFIHRMSSPRHHVPKVYEVTLKHPMDATAVERLRQGVVLDDDPAPVSAEEAQLLSPQHLSLTLIQGKYHQVKRMVAAVGNRVEALHRSAVGGVRLPDDLPSGQWRWLTPQEVADLAGRSPKP